MRRRAPSLLWSVGQLRLFKLVRAHDGGYRGACCKALKSGGKVAYSGGEPKVGAKNIPVVVMEEITDPEELARARVQRERFDHNWAWFQAHSPEVYSRYRGKCICIAGQELFAADTPEQAIALATAEHPEDHGRFVHYIPREKMARIYAH